VDEVASKPAKRGRKPKPPAQPVLTSSDSEISNGGKTAAVTGSTTNLGELDTLDHDIQYWLMKAEPESRIEKGHDVKFSIDDLEAKTEPEAWDGKLAGGAMETRFVDHH
jgi:hypothetical protein